MDVLINFFVKFSQEKTFSISLCRKMNNRRIACSTFAIDQRNESKTPYFNPKPKRKLPNNADNTPHHFVMTTADKIIIMLIKKCDKPFISAEADIFSMLNKDIIVINVAFTKDIKK